jgi:hypothetical protein
MVPVQADQAPFCTWPFAGFRVSEMVSVSEITCVGVLQPVTWASAVPLYPVPEGSRVTGNGV